MKDYRSNKSHNSRLKRLVDRLLLFILVDYISCEPNLLAPNIKQYDKQLTVAKLNLMKRAAKHILLNRSNFTTQQNVPELQASCQSQSPKKLITTQIAPQKKDSIHSADNNSAKKSTDSSNKKGNSSKIFEQIQSANFTITNIFEIKTDIFERISNHLINLIDVSRKSKQQNTHKICAWTKKLKAKLQMHCKK